MNLNKATAEDILDVSQGMANNGRSKVDLIKRKVSRRDSSTTYQTSCTVAGILRPVLCYQKRKGVWLEPTMPCLTSRIWRLVRDRRVNYVMGRDFRGKKVALVSHLEVRRVLLNSNKWDLKENQNWGPSEPNKRELGSTKRLTIWQKIIRCLKIIIK